MDVDEYRDLNFKKPKYGNKKSKRRIDGKMVTFDSKIEAERAMYLVALRNEGVIHSLEFQPEYILQDGFRRHGKTIRAIKYKADFRYTQDEKTVVEDVKGKKTTEYMLKKKLFLFHHGENIQFVEVYRKKSGFSEVII